MSRPVGGTEWEVINVTTMRHTKPHYVMVRRDKDYEKLRAEWVAAFGPRLGLIERSWKFITRRPS